MVTVQYCHSASSPSAGLEQSPSTMLNTALWQLSGGKVLAGMEPQCRRWAMHLGPSDIAASSRGKRRRDRRQMSVWLS